MGKEIQAIRGMNDILPEQMPYWHRLEQACRDVVRCCGFAEIRMPVLEQTDLFARSIGGDTDIVAKEMYTFADRNGDSLTLRPEGTAGCVRSGIEHSLFYNQAQRLWYMGPMFRHERPQKGRYRQFYQFGVEAYGMTGPAIEAELLYVAWRLWDVLGLKDQVELQLNHLGSAQMRATYKAELVAYLSQYVDQLDADSKRRLETNPLRILDSKVVETQEILDQGPQLIDYLDDDSRAHLELLESYLTTLGIPYTVNTRLVRGLDYYDGVVFEWITDSLGAQGTICAGGRYDGLVEQLGGRQTPAIGFACGLERLVLLMQAHQEVRSSVNVYILLLDDSVIAHGLKVAATLRAALPTAAVVTHLSGGKAKNQFKRADKSGAHYALVIGEDESNSGEYVLKPLRTREPQQTLSLEQCIDHIAGTC